jgi:hypothetical protein
MTDTQLYLAMGAPLLFNGLLFLMLLTKINHLETKFDANFGTLMAKFMDVDSRLSHVEAKLGIG